MCDFPPAHTLRSIGATNYANITKEKTNMNMLIVALAMLLPALETFAQSEAALVEKLAGKQVKIKLDMPASKDGMDIYSDSTNPVKWSDYANRLKEHGRG